MRKIQIAVIDGQGGGIGKTIISKLVEVVPNADILALGTNAVATSNMMKVKEVKGATGENAIIFNVGNSDIIVGPIGIIMPNGLTGEISPRIAEAIGSTYAKKILVPSNRCNIKVASGSEQTLQVYIDHCIELIRKEVEDIEKSRL